MLLACFDWKLTKSIGPRKATLWSIWNSEINNGVKWNP